VSWTRGSRTTGSWGLKDGVNAEIKGILVRKEFCRVSKLQWGGMDQWILGKAVNKIISWSKNEKDRGEGLPLGGGEEPRNHPNLSKKTGGGEVPIGTGVRD